MKSKVRFKIVIVILTLQSCVAHHDKMMQDSKNVFNKEGFFQFSSESEQAIKSIFLILNDSSNSIIPLNEKEAYWTLISKEGEHKKKYYKYQNDCKSIYLSVNSLDINKLNKNLANLLKNEISKLDTNINKVIEVCNLGTNKKPRIEMRIKSEIVNGDYSFLLINHELSNNLDRKTKMKIANIEEELVKTKMINAEILYWIGVSSEIGFFD